MQYTSGKRKGKYFASCRNCHLQRQRKYDGCRKHRSKTKAKKVYMREYMLKTKYGISLDEYNTLLEKQNGVCAICKLPERANSKHGVLNNLAVDHNHKTEKVRGLLCYSCNVKLGYLENIDFMLEAKLYLAEHDD